MNRTVREILERIEPGYTTRTMGSGHYVIVGPDGKDVRKEGGLPLVIPSSPSDFRATANIIADLKRSGLWTIPIRKQKVRTIMVRDDLVEVHDHAANNLATKQLVSDLEQVKVRPVTLRDYQELVEILVFLTGEKSWVLNESAAKLFNNMALSATDREPFILLHQVLSSEEDPIQARFRLLRRAKGLPTMEPEPEIHTNLDDLEPEQEEEMEPLMHQMSGTTAVVTVEAMVGEFISDLRDRVTRMMDEINRMEDLIQTLEQQYPSIQIEATEKTPEREPRAPVSVRVGPETSNGGSSTQRTPDRPRSGQGSQANRKPAVKITNDDVYEKLAEGGEWTLQEIAESLNVTIPTVSRRIHELVEQGRIVLVNPARMAGPEGRIPGTYGAAEFFGGNNQS